MKKLRIILLLLIWSLTIPSCQDTLEVNPTSVITNSSFWKTENDAVGALNGMYVDLRSMSEAIYQNGEQRSEIYQGGAFGVGVYNLLFNDLSGANPYHSDWTGFYKIINSANLIIKYVPSIKFKSEPTKNKILAQAYTMRAYAYFNMTKTWGNLIIRTLPTEGSNPEETIKERSPQSEVFALIKADIENAIKLFPDNIFPTGRYFWSLPAVNAFKGEVFLWTGKKLGGGAADFTTALSALNLAETSDVMLLPQFGDLFQYTNKGNKEILMSIRYQDLDGPTNGFWHKWIIGGAVPSNIDAETKALINPIGSGQGLLVLTDLVRKQFNDKDTRKKASFHEIYTYDANGKATFYSTLCLKGKGLLTGGSRVFVDDIILYRYADVLLMKAEAKNALGQDPSLEMNLIRKRAYGTNYASNVFVNGTKTQNDDTILKERLFELLYEGKRWWDLVRFDKAFDLVPNLQSRKGQDYLLLFPISNTVLSLEPKVKQNPGYK